LSEPAAKKLKVEEGSDAPAPVLSEPAAKKLKVEEGSVYERFMTKPVDGEDAYNSFVEFFEFQRNGRNQLNDEYSDSDEDTGVPSMDDFLFAVG
jgi:hypothetical protein